MVDKRFTIKCGHFIKLGFKINWSCSKIVSRIFRRVQLLYLLKFSFLKGFIVRKGPIKIESRVMNIHFKDLYSILFDLVS